MDELFKQILYCTKDAQAAFDQGKFSHAIFQLTRARDAARFVVAIALEIVNGEESNESSDTGKQGGEESNEATGG